MGAMDYIIARKSTEEESMNVSSINYIEKTFAGMEDSKALFAQNTE